MDRVLHVVLAGLLVLPVTGSLGCSGKDEAKPNPDLKVPDVPPSTREAEGKGGPTGPPKK